MAARMDGLPPLQVTLVRRGWSCILDVRLALAPLGPMLALRLAEELPVCLVPTLWQVLDNTAYFDSDPDALFGDPLVPEGYPSGFFASPALAQWERARSLVGLSSRGIYWAGEALSQSSLPKEVDPGVVRRFDAFAHCLEQRLQGARPELATAPPYPLLEGGIGALALAAAMTRYRPRILSLAVPGGAEPPPLCRLLGLCGIPTRRLDPAEAQETRQALGQLLAHTGVMDLIWAGLKPIAVHLVVPGGLDLDPPEPDPEVDTGLGPLGPDGADGPDGWAGAAAFWYPLP
jgi:hypothetical protein